jgi:hypothetical protein
MMATADAATAVALLGGFGGPGIRTDAGLIGTPPGPIGTPPGVMGTAPGVPGLMIPVADSPRSLG